MTKQRDITIRELYNNSVQLAVNLCHKMEPLYNRQLPAAYPPPANPTETVSDPVTGDEATGDA